MGKFKSVEGISHFFLRLCVHVLTAALLVELNPSIFSMGVRARRRYGEFFLRGVEEEKFNAAWVWGTRGTDGEEGEKQFEDNDECVRAWGMSCEAYLGLGKWGVGRDGGGFV